jgi:anaerobic selenocysteine-containing dehydrogenase
VRTVDRKVRTMSVDPAASNPSVETRRSFCRVCHASCPIDVDVDVSDASVPGGRVVAVRGVPDDPLFEGYTCIKGRQLPEQMHHPARLRSTLRREPDGRLAEVSGSAAFDEIAQRLAAIIERHGPRAVASYTGTGGYQNSVAVPVARAFHTGIGSPSFYTSVTIDQPAKTTAPMRLGAWEAGYHNFRDADVSMAIGYNPMVSSYGAVGGLQGTNPFTVMRRAKARGMKLIVVDPRKTELAAFADVFLQIRPGEDPTLLAGMVHIVLEEDLIDHEFCDRWVSGLEELAASVAPFTPAYVAQRCGIAIDDLFRATRMLAAGPRGTVGTGTGPNMAPHSSLTEHFALVLNTILGRVNRAGDRLESGLFLYPETPRRAQVVAPRVPTSGHPARFRGLRGYRGEMPTTTLAEEILQEGDGQIRALIVSGGNPAVAWPDQELTLRALRDLELLVVIDHRMTATAELADYVIAPKLSLERADVPHLMDRWFRAPYSMYTPVTIEASDDVYNEWEVFWEIARRLGSEIPVLGGPLPMDVKPTDDEVIDLVYANSRMPLDVVRANQGVVHEELAMVVQEAEESATARFTVAPEDLMAELAVVRAESTGAEVFAGYTEGAYPFRLVSRRLKAVLNSLGTELSALRRSAGTTNYAYMHPSDLSELGLADDDLIDITSPHGTITGVVAGSPDVRRGVISMAHSWGGTALTDEKVRDIGTPTNRLVSTTDAYDPVTGMVVQSAIPVRVERSVLSEAVGEALNGATERTKELV